MRSRNVAKGTAVGGAGDEDDDDDDGEGGEGELSGRHSFTQPSQEAERRPALSMKFQSTEAGFVDEVPVYADNLGGVRSPAFNGSSVRRAGIPHGDGPVGRGRGYLVLVPFVPRAIVQAFWTQEIAHFNEDPLFFFQHVNLPSSHDAKVLGSGNSKSSLLER
eukprot:CAMPEP_0171678268 /NCGR_PEP_ID=MMETSP0990-20121206/55578_1 /TAXON_ID=483369 /ORGANISM="non described non described, Strain CCMP2098" /LENGTH=161 /DNA_ID=CAMNT_0012264905 /DNA_START=1353 /DNA_END=1838 /DNA_ORIENTATION=+